MLPLYVFSIALILYTKTVQGDSSEDELTFSNCSEALMTTHQNGVYNIALRNYRRPFEVYCDGETFGGNWTVIQRREDGFVDFNRNWREYKKGFGDLYGEFFIGLNKLHALTTESPQELLIELESFENETRYAKYDAFAIGGQDSFYTLNVLGNYSGDAGESLRRHENTKFSTKDKDKDRHGLEHCARRFQSGWWFNHCHRCNLNGVYSTNSTVRGQQGINWGSFKGDWYSLKSARMLIRPKSVGNPKQ